MEAFFPCLAKIFGPIALMCLAWWVLVAIAVVHVAADIALGVWLKRAREELQQIVGQYQPDYVPYQAMALNKALKVTRIILFYPVIILILAMMLACTVFFPSVFMAIAKRPIEAQAVSLSFRRAWLNPFDGTMTLRNVKASRSNDDHMDFDVEFDSVDLDLRLLSASDPIHRYDRIVLRKATGSLVMIDSVNKNIDPKDAVIVNSVRVDDFHVALTDLSLRPMAGQPAPSINYDIQINQMIITPFRTLHPAFDLMTNMSGSGTVDSHIFECRRSVDGKDLVVTMHFEGIDLGKFGHYLRTLMPQIAGGTLDIDFVQKVNAEPAEPVAFETRYTFRHINTQPVDKAQIVNPKIFAKLNDYLAAHRELVQVNTKINVDRKTFDEAPSLYSTGAVSLQKKNFESSLTTMLLHETNLTATPQGIQIEQIKSLIPPPNPSKSR